MPPPLPLGCDQQQLANQPGGFLDRKGGCLWNWAGGELQQGQVARSRTAKGKPPAASGHHHQAEAPGGKTATARDSEVGERRACFTRDASVRDSETRASSRQPGRGLPATLACEWTGLNHLTSSPPQADPACPVAIHQPPQGCPY